MKTKKDFELVASVIASIANSETRKVMSEHWALELAKSNPRFDFKRFIKACGVKLEPEAGTVVPLPPELKREKVLHRAGQTLREAGYKNLC